MQKYIDAHTYFAEAQILWTDCQEACVFIEGRSDKVFFNTLVQLGAKVRFLDVCGWENVNRIVRIAQEKGCSHIAGIVDRDYHEMIEDGIRESNQLFFTDYNDIEMMLFASNSFERFLSVCADQSKIKKQVDPRKPIITAASYLGALRVISLANQYSLDFDGFECKNYVSRNDLKADYIQLINIIIQRTRSGGNVVAASNKSVQEQIERLVQKYDALDLCNGHDILDILGLSMSKFYSSASANQYATDNLFNYLLIGYSTEEFQNSNLYKKLANWLAATVNPV